MRPCLQMNLYGGQLQPVHAVKQLQRQTACCITHGMRHIVFAVCKRVSYTLCWALSTANCTEWHKLVDLIRQARENTPEVGGEANRLG